MQSCRWLEMAARCAMIVAALGVAALTGGARASGAAVGEALGGAALGGAALGEDAFELNERAVAALERGDYAEAVRLLTLARKANPDNPTLRENLAEARFRAGADHCRRGDYERSISELQEALALRADQARVHLFLGVAFYHTERLQSAEASLRKAAELDASDSAAHENLGHVLYKRGQSEDAVREWEKAIALGSPSDSLRGLADRVKREIEVESRFLASRTEHFDLRYDSAIDEDLLEVAHRAVETAYLRVGRALGSYPAEPVPVILYTRSGFSAVTEGHRWIAGLFDGRIRIPVDREVREASLADTLTHEYTHYAIHAMAPRCPTWLHEGIAQWVEGRRADGEASRLARALARGQLDSILDLTRSFAKTEDPEAALVQYAQALSFVEFLVREHGEGAVAAIVKALASMPIEESIGKATGVSTTELEAAWRRSIAR